jgi:hypothetical protein
MQMMWCWRCQNIVPMLDDGEFRAVWTLYSEGWEMLRRASLAGTLSASTREEAFTPALREYERTTGHYEPNPNVIMHHRISLYGSPCSTCGKPLRSPKASYCTACGAPA